MTNPWIVFFTTAGVFALVVTVCWILIALPFALIHNALKNTLTSAHEHLKFFSDHLWEKSHAVLGSVREPVEDFVTQSRYKIFFYERERDFHQKMALVRSQLLEIDDRTAREVAGLASNTKALSVELAALNEIDLSHREIEIPDYEDVHDLQKERRYGWTLFGTTAPFLIGLIILNTWMLSIFFNEKLTDQYVWFAIGLKAGNVLAFMFSGFEVVLGVLLFTLEDKSANNGHRPEFRYAIWLILAILAFVESFIYMQLSMAFAGVEMGDLQGLPLFELLTSVWITPFGLAVVLGLAMIGHFCAEGIYRIRDAGDYDAFRRQLDLAHTIATKLMGLMDASRDQMGSMKERLVNFLDDVKSTTDDKSGLGKKLSAVTKNIRAAADDTEGLKTGLYIDVPEPDALREYYKSLFLASLGLIMIVFFGLIQTKLLSTAPIFSNLSDFVKGLLAFLLVGTLVGSGHVLAQKLILAEGESEITVQESPHALFMRIAALIAIFSIVAFTAHITLILQVEADWTSFTLMLALISFSVWLGASLKVLLQALWAFIRSVVRGLLAVLIWVLAAIVAGLGLAMNLIAVVFWVLAYPILRIIKHFWQSSPNLASDPRSESLQ